MAKHFERDDCSTENSPNFVTWIKRSLKASPEERGGLSDVRVTGYVGPPRSGSANTIYPVRFSYVHKPGDPPQEYSWAYNVPQDHDDDDPFIPREHVDYQLNSLAGSLTTRSISAVVQGTGLEAVLVVSRK